MSTIVKIKALKYPAILHYEWEGEILEITPEYILVLCKHGRKLIHHTKNKVFTMNNTSVEYFPLNEWYTAAMQVENGVVVSHYCNIAKPSVFKDNEISFIDLDLDYIQKKNQDWEVVDIDEFETNSIRYQYPPELKTEAVKALETLKKAIKCGRFPFTNQIMSRIK